MSTQPLLQRTAAKRIALPVRQEPKVRCLASALSHFGAAWLLSRKFRKEGYQRERGEGRVSADAIGTSVGSCLFDQDWLVDGKGDPTSPTA